MAGDYRKVNRHVGYRRSGKTRPAVITAVGAGTSINLRVVHQGETGSNISKWSRSTPGTAGWVRGGG